MRSAPMDSQDLIAWGVVREDKVFAERKRINTLCEWAARVGIDGFVRCVPCPYVSAACPR